MSELGAITESMNRLNSNVGGFRDEAINQMIDSNMSLSGILDLIREQTKDFKDALNKQTKDTVAAEDNRETRKETEQRARDKNVKTTRGGGAGDEVSQSAARTGISALLGVDIGGIVGGIASLSVIAIGVLTRYEQIFGDDGDLMGAFTAINGFFAAPTILGSISGLIRSVPLLNRTLGPTLTLLGRLPGMLPVIGTMFKSLGKASGIFTAVVAIFDGIAAVTRLENNEVIGPAERFAAFLDGALRGFISLFGDVGELLAGATGMVMGFLGFSDEQTEAVQGGIRGFFNAIENILNFVADLFEPIVEMASIAGMWLGEAAEVATEFVQGFIDNFDDFVSGIQENAILGPLLSGLESIWNGITNFFGEDGPIGGIISGATEWLSRFGIALPENIFERQTPEERQAGIQARAERGAQRRLEREAARDARRARRGDVRQRGRDAASGAADMLRRDIEFPGTRPMDVTGWEGFADSGSIEFPGTRPMDVTGWEGFADSRRPGLVPVNRAPMSQQVNLITTGIPLAEQMNRTNDAALQELVDGWEPRIRSSIRAQRPDPIMELNDEIRSSSGGGGFVLAPTDNSRSVQVNNNSSHTFAGRGSSVNRNDPAVRAPTSY
jgi:hypothetical protein